MSCRRVVFSSVSAPYASPNSPLYKSTPSVSHSISFGRDDTWHFSSTAAAISATGSDTAPSERKLSTHSCFAQHLACVSASAVLATYAWTPNSSAAPAAAAATCASTVASSTSTDADGCAATLHNSTNARSATDRASGSEMPSFCSSICGLTSFRSGATSRESFTSLHMFSMMMQHLRLTSVLPFKPRSSTGVVMASAAASTSCTNTQPAKPSTVSGTSSGFWIASESCGTNTAMSSFPEQ